MSEALVAAEVFPPGEYLRDELDERGWTLAEFAEILGRPVQAISEIVNAKKEITAETATEIGRALGTSPELWLNLQSTYRLRDANRPSRHLDDVVRRARLRSLVPLAEIRRRGWVDAEVGLDATEAAVRDLLGITDLDEPPSFALAARRANDGDPLTATQQAWLGRVRQLGAAAEVAGFDRAAMVGLAEGLATRLRDSRAFAELPVWLSQVGVAFVVVPALKGSRIDGAVLLSSTGTPIVGLSLRGRRFDSAVFTLAHELAHIALGHVAARSVVIDEQRLDGPASGIEAEADRLASSWLFPVDPVVAEPITAARIRQVADELGCHPALVVGRLQWQGRVPWNRFNSLVPRAEATPD